jgi:crotonobetainyl-CoA:carnitine CoA-transferase CaiB-like acyl-CoA transferase
VFEVARAADGTKDHIIIAVGNDSQFRKYCEVASVPELGVNLLFALNRDRVKNRAQLVPLLEAAMRTRSKADWLAALEAAKVPCGAINNLAEVFADPHVQSRGMVTRWQHPHQSDLRLVSSPLKLSATPVRTDMPPPLLGQHTDEVLRSVLNYPDAKLSELKRNQVI